MKRFADVLKKIGWGAFFFFLIKGLLWLVVFFGGLKWLMGLFGK
jgi:hypothetical protein